eukprot:TRINITY_DN772_c1_g2_i1.p1 TRINITY_DN772_c1_g2~~TRINITY_DN772_c1_g2_i1.p1  ORF type:complete len:822 (+),score=401.78 TRINITY_DN772_c1_g2_i1:18-2483(+)
MKIIKNRNSNFLIFYLFIALFLQFVINLNGCGVTLHNAIVWRALNWFQSNNFPDYVEILKNNPGALQNGATFPDWGYSCGFPDESEATHWPPFTNASIQYVRQNYQQPWNSTAQQLIAFLFGIWSHSVADISWHDLGIVSNNQQGFIQSMADLNFDGFFSDAHTAADVGGEFVVAYEMDISWMQPEKWVLPVDDLVTIYHSIGYTNVTAKRMTQCNDLLVAEAIAIKTVGFEGYPYAVRNSPFLAEQLHPYWMGGLNDNSAWTQWCWSDIVRWLENGPDSSICLVESGYSVSSKTIPCKTDVGTSIIEKINQLPKQDALPNVEVCSTEAGPEQVSSLIIEGTTNYGYLGWSIASGDFNADGIQDLIIGEPGWGPVGQPMTGGIYVIFGREGDSGHNQTRYLTTDNADVFINGPSVYSKFGFAVTVLDFNADGIDDIAVGAPTIGSENLGYQGEIHIFFGTSNEFYKQRREKLSAMNIQIEADFIIWSKENFTNLGQVVYSADINNDGFKDLIIGAPFAQIGDFKYQRGKVAIFYSNQFRNSKNKLCFENDADWQFSGEDQYNWFGSSIFFANSNQNSNLNSLLLIGAPTFKNGDIQSTGKLYAFDTKSLSMNSKPKWTITNVDEFDQFANSITVGNPFNSNSSQRILAIGASSATLGRSFSKLEQAGKVILFNLDQILDGDHSLNKMKILATFEASERLERLGSSINFQDINNDKIDELWLNAPYAKYNLNSIQVTSTGIESGILFAFIGNENFTTSTIDNVFEASDWCVVGSTKKTRFAQKFIFSDLNNDNQIDLITSGPFSGTTQQGFVSIIFNVANAF